MGDTADILCGCLPWGRRHKSGNAVRGRPSSARPVRPASARPTSARPASATRAGARPVSATRGSKTAVTARKQGAAAARVEPAPLGWKFQAEAEAEAGAEEGSTEGGGRHARESTGSGAESHSETDSSGGSSPAAPLPPARSRASITAASTAFGPEHHFSDAPLALADRYGSATAAEQPGATGGRRLDDPDLDSPRSHGQHSGRRGQGWGQVPAAGSQTSGGGGDAASRLQALQELHRMRRASAVGGTGDGAGAAYAPATTAAAAAAAQQQQQQQLLGDTHLQCDSFSYAAHPQPHHAAPHTRLAPAGGTHAPTRLTPLPPLRPLHGAGAPGSPQAGAGPSPVRHALPLFDSPLHSRHGSITAAAIPGSLPSVSYPGMGSSHPHPANTGLAAAPAMAAGWDAPRPGLAPATPPHPPYGLSGDPPGRSAQPQELWPRQQEQRPPPWGQAEEQQRYQQPGGAEQRGAPAGEEREQPLVEYEPWGSGPETRVHGGDPGSGGYVSAAHRDLAHTPSRLSGSGARGQAREDPLPLPADPLRSSHSLQRHNAHGPAGYSSAPAEQPPAPLGPRAYSKQPSGYQGRGVGGGVAFSADTRDTESAPLHPAANAGLQLGRMSSSGVGLGGLGGMAAPRPVPLASEPSAGESHAVPPGNAPVPLFSKTASLRPPPPQQQQQQQQQQLGLQEAGGQGPGERSSRDRVRPSPSQRLQLWQEDAYRPEQEPFPPPQRPAPLPVLSPATSAKALVSAPGSEPPPAPPKPSSVFGTPFGAELGLDEEPVAALQWGTAAAARGSREQPWAEPSAPAETEVEVVAAGAGRTDSVWSPSQQPPLPAAEQTAPYQTPATERKAAALTNAAMLELLLSGGGGKGGGLDFSSVRTGNSTAEELERFDRVDNAMYRLESIFAASVSTARPPPAGELARPPNASYASAGNADSDFVGSSPVGQQARMSMRVQPW